MAFKDFARRTASDKILRNNEFNIGKNPKYGKYQRDLPFLKKRNLDKETSGGTIKKWEYFFQRISLRIT